MRIHKIFYIVLCLCVAGIATAQKPLIKGTVTDSKTNLPLEGVSVIALPLHLTTVTDANGRFSLKQNSITIDSLELYAIGYEKKLIAAQSLTVTNTIALNQQRVQLRDVTVKTVSNNPYKPISKLDISMRGVNNSQEVLRIVPGLFIGQHQGGGKAEQIFLRGFDCDHGTDIALFADGLPINLVSHAHGQGYADAHFIIPETIEQASVKKGPYYAEKGDFNTSGFVDFKTANALPNNTIKLEGGMYHTYRALGMFNLLGEQAKQQQQSWYVASEYNYSDSYFDNPQHFNRFNFFTKYHGKVAGHSFLTLSASTLYSKWDASGQIPDRAVDKGLIGFYGALDPTEGGKTSRTNFNAQLVTNLQNGDLLKNQVYYSRYNFDLHTNFTFFLVDTVNGDQIRQKEARNLLGYNGSYIHESSVAGMKFTTEAGINLRYDATNNSELSHTKDRFITLQRYKLGDITELDAAAYVSETIRLQEKWSLNAGIRFDQFVNRYNNKLPSDSTLNGVGIYDARANTVSPKLSLYYQASNSTQFYITTGRGFHSNDTRAVVVTHGKQILPPAYGADLGTIFKPAPNVFIQAAVWYLWLNQEFVYGGDGGIVELSGKTRRIGADFSARYAPVHSIYFDVDLNYAHGRSTEDPKGQNYIPLAPVWSSTGGVTYTGKTGLKASLRYRYLGNRPAIEDYSLTAKGYFVTDAVISYAKNRYEIGLTVNNLLDTKWKETQFATETRLKNEAAPVTEVCFTPGTKLMAHISLSYYFK